MNINRWQRTGFGVGGLVALAVLFLAVVMLSNLGLRGMRIDLTQNRLYTLSPGTKQVLARAQGAGQSVLLLLARRGGEAVAADHAVCESGARVSRGDQGPIGRQDPSSGDRSAAVFRGRGPRGRGRTAILERGRRRVAVLWPRGHQLDRRTLGHSRAFSPTARNSSNTTWRSSSRSWRLPRSPSSG